VSGHRKAFAGVALALSLVASFALLEVGLRAVSRVDVDGNVFVGGWRLLPFRLPIESARARVAEYLARGDRTYFVYDPDIGWTVRPMGTSDDGLYIANERGIRTDATRRPTARAAAPGTLRVALFGDSFTHCNDVPFAQSWGAQLEEDLERLGVRAEVLNLGGSGYAMDQALWRFEKEGRPLSPDVVVFGFQNTNVRRNLNLIRLLYNPDTGLIFAKPRFVLEGGALRVVDRPAPRPEQLPAILADFEHWPASRYEFFYEARNYRDSFFYHSRVIALAASGVRTRFSQKRKSHDFFAPGTRSRAIARSILDRFEAESTGAGARLLVVHLPTRKPIKRLVAGRPLKYADFYREIRSDFEVADPAPALREHAQQQGLESLFAPVGGHYSGAANRIVAATVADALVSSRR